MCRLFTVLTLPQTLTTCFSLHWVVSFSSSSLCHTVYLRQFPFSSFFFIVRSSKSSASHLPSVFFYIGFFPLYQLTHCHVLIYGNYQAWDNQGCPPCQDLGNDRVQGICASCSTVFFSPPLLVSSIALFQMRRHAVSLSPCAHFVM